MIFLQSGTTNKLVVIMIMESTINEDKIRIRYGISGKDSCNIMSTIGESARAATAPFADDRFQKIPNRNTTVIPGYINPQNCCK